MPEEDVQLVRKAFNGTGLQSLGEVAEAYWDPDVEYVEDPRWPGAGRYRGREEVLRIFQSYIDALGPDESGSAVLEQIIDAGGRQVAFVRFQGRSASGVPHDYLWGYVVEVRNRHIVYFRAYYEPAEALEAAG
jgi:ketosteroid isomerase-like protein